MGPAATVVILQQEMYMEIGPSRRDEERHREDKLGWVIGVLVPCLLGTWGVTIFMRLPWIIANSGILDSSGAVVLTTAICSVTTFSMNAMSTNGEMEKGGVYYMISRNLGLSFGACSGLSFAVANVITVAMNIVGFAELVKALLRMYNVTITNNDTNDIRILAVVTLFIVTNISVFGVKWEIKVQVIFLCIIVVAILNVIIGAIIGPTDKLQEAYGFLGFSKTIFMDNLFSDYRFFENIHQSFFTIFAIFFPSVTGIQSGANMSDDLRNPSKSIPFGTIVSLIISMSTYMILVLCIGGGSIRDASGLIDVNGTIISCSANITCSYGLHNDLSMLHNISRWNWLVYAGCFAASICTAMTNFLSVSRLIQALGKDNVFPGSRILSKGYGKNNEPYIAYAVTFIAVLCLVLLEDTNALSPLVAILYLTSYGIINFSAGFMSFNRWLGWRPTFKYYNIWVSALGFILCWTSMTFISWSIFLIVHGICIVTFLIVKLQKLDVNLDSSKQARIYKTAVSAIYKLNSMKEHVKNYTPRILALSGAPGVRPALSHLGYLITKGNSLLMSAEIYSDHLPYTIRLEREKTGYAWFDEQNIRSFYQMLEEPSFERGASALMQVTGIGKLKPNIVLLGYKSDWQNCDCDDLQEYFNVLQNAFDLNLAVAILRNTECWSSSEPATGNENNEPVSAQSNDDRVEEISIHEDNNVSTSNETSQVFSLSAIVLATRMFMAPVNIQPTFEEDPSNIPGSSNGQHSSNIRNYVIGKLIGKKRKTTGVPPHLSVFEKKHKKGTIDVWWIYEDGGLTILLPYIISTRCRWHNCRIRLFILASSTQTIMKQQEEMTEVIKKFRIKYNDLKIIDTSVEPSRKTLDFFNRLVSEYQPDNSDTCISKSELNSLKSVTNHQLRLRELLLENSSESTLIIMSLPVLRQGTISPPLYMAWLESITRNLPPTLLINGNNTPALTIHS